MTRWRPVLLALAVVAGGASAEDIELEFTEDALNQLILHLGDPSDGGIYHPTPGQGSGLFDDCVPYGYLECPRATDTGPATPNPGANANARPTGSRPATYDRLARLPLSRCRRPNGSLLIVPAHVAVSWQWWVTETRFTVEDGGLSLSATVRARVGERWSAETRTVPASFQLDPGTHRLRLRSAAFKVPVRHEADGLAQVITQVDVGRLLSFAVPITPQPLKVRRVDGSQRTINARAQGANVRYLPGRVQVRIDVAFF